MRQNVRADRLIHGRLVRKALLALQDRLTGVDTAPPVLVKRLFALAALLATGRLRKQVDARIRELGPEDLVAALASKSALMAIAMDE